MFILSNAAAREPYPPRRRPFVVHLKVVDAVGGHGLDDCHVVDDGLAARLTGRLLVVLDHLVLAVGAGWLLFEHITGQEGVFLQQRPRSGFVLYKEGGFLIRTLAT